VDLPIADTILPVIIQNGSHKYRYELGQERSWRQGPVSYLMLRTEAPAGVDITITEVSLRRRMLPALDTRLNTWVSNLFNLRRIDPIFIPSYLLGTFLIASGLLYIRLFIRRSRPYKVFATIALIALLASLIPFFVTRQVKEVRSHYRMQAETIRTKGLKHTYDGFLDYRVFLRWVAQNIPEEADIIFLVRGEPVYIMSEALYSLYPRKIEFVNISEGYLRASESIKGHKDHKYMIALSSEDFMRVRSIKGLHIIDRFRPYSGFIIELNIN
jgi:hypothetical protein